MKGIWVVGLLVIIALVAGALAFFPSEWRGNALPETGGDSRTSALALAEKTAVFESGKEITYRIAEPFDIAVAAEGIGKARFMAMSPDGRMFVPDLVNYNLSHEGKLYVLDDWNEATKKFESTHTYLSGLRGPNSVAFYRDENGRDWLYLALTKHLVRYPYTAGDLAPSGPAEIITEFPNTQTPGETSVVWHITRTIKFHDGKLYIAVGSGCNSCEQPKEELRAMVMVMNPDGTGRKVYAEGLRNSVGMTFAEGDLYVTANGVDHLGEDKPDELMHKIAEGKHYGWPYCYETGGKVVPDTTGIWNNPIPCERIPHSFASFTARAAPLGLEYFENAHPVLDDAFLVALHGSFEPEIGAGYQIVRVSKTGEKSVFMDGFQLPNYERVGRPVDILQRDEKSFFVSDDHAGAIYLLYAP